MTPVKSDPLRDYVARDRNQVAGWFSRIDAEIVYAVLSAQKERSLRGSTVEIGLHHGKLFVALCLSLHDTEKAYGVDLFESQALNRDGSGKGDRQVLERNLARFEIDSSKVILDARSSQNVKASDILQAVGAARFFSVDGGHWLEMVQSDLRLAEQCIAEHGVIALDDFHRPEWPDVSAAYLSWAANRSRAIVPFAIGFNKLYLCSEDWLDFYQLSLEKNPVLKHFLAKRYQFQGHMTPVYHALVLPEAPLRARFLDFMRYHNTDLYLRLRALTRKLARSALPRFSRRPL